MPFVWQPTMKKLPLRCAKTLTKTRRAFVMTGDCRTGTDRLAQAVQKLEFDLENLIVINVQGDEPFINPRHIELLIDAMKSDSTLQMATLATPLPEHLTNDTNVVKVVCAQNGNALYFSRLPIPFARDGETVNVPRLRHLGVYAYTAKWLLQMAALPSTPLEETEKLEQLRALENGVALRVVKVENVIDIAIDTPEDLQRAEAFLATENTDRHEIFENAIFNENYPPKVIYFHLCSLWLKTLWLIETLQEEIIACHRCPRLVAMARRCGGESAAAVSRRRLLGAACAELWR